MNGPARPVVCTQQAGVTVQTSKVSRRSSIEYIVSKIESRLSISNLHIRLVSKVLQPPSIQLHNMFQAVLECDDIATHIARHSMVTLDLNGAGRPSCHVDNDLQIFPRATALLSLTRRTRVLYTSLMQDGILKIETSLQVRFRLVPHVRIGYYEGGVQMPYMWIVEMPIYGIVGNVYPCTRLFHRSSVSPKVAMCTTAEFVSDIREAFRYLDDGSECLRDLASWLEFVGLSIPELIDKVIQPLTKPLGHMWDAHTHTFLPSSRRAKMRALFPKM